jgi:hypothetical protein
MLLYTQNLTTFRHGYIPQTGRRTPQFGGAKCSGLVATQRTTALLLVGGKTVILAHTVLKHKGY